MKALYYSISTAFFISLFIIPLAYMYVDINSSVPKWFFIYTAIVFVNSSGILSFEIYKLFRNH